MPRETPLAVLILGMTLAIAPLIVLSQFIAHVWIETGDDQMFGYYGWRISQGAVIYLDIWDNKPPGVYWLNALGFLIGGGGYEGVIVLCVAALIVTHVCFFATAASLMNRGAAAIGTVLFGFFITHAHFEGGANRTETFLVACELLAVLLYVRGFARDRWWTWLAAGLFCGTAFLFKQVGLAAWGAMGLHTIFLVCMRQLNLTDGLRRCLLLLLGVLIMVAAAAGLLWLQGGTAAIAEAIFATFTFNRTYFAANHSSFAHYRTALTLLKVHIFPVMKLPLLMAAAAAIHAGLNWLHRRGQPVVPPTPRRLVCPAYMLLFALWFLIAFYGAMLSPQKFRWYLTPTLPPLLLMGTYLLHQLKAEARMLSRLRRRAWVVAAVVIMGYFIYPAVDTLVGLASEVWIFRYESKHPHGWRAQREWEVVGDAVLRVSKPGDKIQCWGWMPGVYLYTRRENACRFTTTEKCGQVSAGADFVLDEISESLRNQVPAVLVLRHDDDARTRGSLLPGESSPIVEQGPLIDAHYELVKEIPEFGTVYIYKRKEAAPRSD